MKNLKDLSEELESQRLLHGENHELTAVILSEIGSFHLSQEEYNKALEYYEKALAIVNEVSGEGSELGIDIEYRIGKVIEAKSILNDRPQDKENYIQKVLSKRENFDSKHDNFNIDEDVVINSSYKSTESVDSTMIYNDMAEEERLNLNFNAAETLYLKSIKLRRKKFGINSPALTPVLINYSELLKQFEKYDSSIIVLEEALSLTVNKFGRLHPTTALIYNNLGQVYKLQSNLMKSEEYLLEALVIRRELYGELNIHVAGTLNNLAELYREKKDYFQAIYFHKLSVEAFVKSVGLLHPGTINAKGNYGITLRRYSDQNSTEGEELIKETVDYLQQNSYEARHPWALKFTSEQILTQAQKLSTQGKHEESLDLFNSVLKKKQVISELNASNSLTSDSVYSNAGFNHNKSQDDSAYQSYDSSYHNTANNSNIVAGALFASPNKISSAINSGVNNNSMTPYASPLKSKNTDYTMMERPQSPGAESQDMHVISKGKFVSMLGKARNLLKKSLFKELDTLLEECSSFPRSFLGDNSNTAVSKGETSELYIDLQIIIAQYKYIAADYTAAHALFILALQAKIDMYGPDALCLVEIMVGLSENYRARAIYDEAETFATQAISLADHAYKNDIQNLTKANRDHVLLLLSATHSMAELQRNQYAYAVAVPLLQQAVEMVMENNLEEESVYGEILTSLGAIEKGRCDFNKSKEYHQQALDIRAKCFGKLHPKTLSSQFHLAQLEYIRTEYTAAETNIENILNGRLAFFGTFPNHPAIAATQLLKGKIAQSLNKLSIASECISSALTAAKQKFDPVPTDEEDEEELSREKSGKHPLIGHLLYQKATFLKLKLDFTESTLYYEAALKTYRNCYGVQSRSNDEKHNIHHDICTATFGIASSFVSKSQLLQSLPVFEDCVSLREQNMNSIGVLYSFHLAEIYLEYGPVLMLTGKVAEAAVIIGKAGVNIFNVLGEKTCHTAYCLFQLAEYNKLCHKYKDAKNQYSLCMAIRHRTLGPQHPLTLETLCSAADNMRRCGYFRDALEAYYILDALNKKYYGDTSDYDVCTLILHANIYCDRLKSVKAEECYNAALEKIKEMYGSTNMRNKYILEIKYGIAKCLQHQHKFSTADKQYKECLEIAKSMYGAQNPTVYDLLSCVQFLRTTHKPAEQLSAISALKDEILPYFATYFGTASPYCGHSKGRMAVLMNVMKKDSGRKLIQEALRCFDEHKQFAFTCDHPWVLEIGGYEKSASKDRSSSSIEEFALAHWAMPAYEGDLQYGKQPKNLWVDTSNNYPDVWGQVHYYGVEHKESNKIANEKSAAHGPRAPTRSSFSGLGVEMPMQKLKAATMHGSSSKLSPESGEFIGESGENAMPSAEMEALMAKEIQLRKEVEDNLLNEQNAAKDLAEQLQQEVEHKQQLADKLAAQEEESRLLQEKVALLMEELNNQKSAKQAAEEAAAAQQTATLALVKEQEERSLQLLSEQAAQTEALAAIVAENAAKEAAEAAAKAEAEAAALNPEPVPVAVAKQYVSGIDSLTGLPLIVIEPVATVITDENIKVALESCKFLFSRATELHMQGWYSKAQPLYEECLLAYETYIPMDAITMDTLYALTLNLSKLYQYTQVETNLALCLVGRERLYGARSEPVAQVMIAQGVNLMLMGRYAESTVRFAEAAKMLSEITENSVNTLYGECICWQSLNSLRIGKIVESRAWNDRSNAILSKKQTLNGLMITQTMFIKAETLITNGKYKEALSMIEQTFIYRKRLCGDSHPLLADCYVQMGVCFLESGKPQEANSKLQLALNIRQKFFPKDDIRVAEVEFYQAKRLFLLEKYHISLEKLENVFSIYNKTLNTAEITHVSTSDVLYVISQIHLKLANYPLAESQLNECLAIRNKNLPENLENYPKIIEINFKLGELNRLLGNYEQAKVLIEESLESLKAVYSKEHPLYLSVQQEYAVILLHCDDLANAEKLNKRCIKYRATALGTDHPDYGYSLLCQCELLRAQNKIEESKPLLYEVILIQKMLHDGSDDSTNVPSDPTSGAENNNDHVASGNNFSEVDAPKVKYSSPSVAVDRELSSFPTPLPSKLEKNATLLSCFIQHANNMLSHLENVNNNPDAYVSITLRNNEETDERDDNSVAAGADGDAADAASVTSSKGRVNDGNHSDEESTIAPAPASAQGTNSSTNNNTSNNTNNNSSNNINIDIEGAESEKVANSDQTTADAKTPDNTDNALEGEANDPELKTGQQPEGQEGSALADIDPEREEDEDSLVDGTDPLVPAPVFDNSAFVELVATYEYIVTLIRAVYKLGGGTVTDDKPDLNNGSSKSHPLLIYIEGNIGIVKLYEYLAKNRFFEALSEEEKESFKRAENKRKKQQKEIVLKPVGLVLIEENVNKLLSQYLLHTNHVWILKYRLIMNSVVFTLDDMELANNYYIEAENMRKNGLFFDADLKYDTVFLTQISTLGPVAASTSLLVADTLYSKAENCRMMGKLELSMVLYNQSISIYRKRLGSDNEGTMRGILGLTELMIAQGMYEDAYAMHLRALSVLSKLHGEESIQVARVKASLTFDLYKLSKFEAAMEMAADTLLLLNKRGLDKERDPEDLSGLYISIAYIYIAQGLFAEGKENIETAQKIIEKAYPNAPDHFSFVYIMQCRAEYLFAINKIQDAYKLITKVMKYRIIAYGRTSPSAGANKGNSDNSKKDDKKTAFYDAFDSLSMESSRIEFEENLKKERKEAKNGIKKAQKPKTKDELEDIALENEMKTVNSDILNDFESSHKPEEDKNRTNNANNANNNANSVDATAAKKSSPVATYTSVSKFAKPDNSQPAFLYKSRPIAAHPAIALVLLIRGKIALTLCDLTEAKYMFDGALAMLNKLYSKQSVNKLSIQYEIAQMITVKGSYDEAKTMHDNILHQRLQVCEDDHPDKSDSLFSIATIQITLSKFDDSTQILADALKIREKVYGESHYKMAECFAGCAEVLHAKGLYAESLGLYEKAAYILHKQFGDMHLLLANVLIGQALCARELGQYDQASSYIEQAMSMRGVLLGDSHPETAKCYYHLASVQRLQGKILQAKRSLDSAIVVQREALGKYHPHTILTLLSLAFNFTDLAKYATAEHVYNRANQLLRKCFGKDHLVIAAGMTGYAENLRLTGFYEKSRELHEKALYLRRKILGERHELVAESMFYLAEIVAVYAKFEDAVKGYDDVLAIQRLALGENHPIVTNTMSSLGKVMLAQGKVQDAKYQFERSYFLRKQILGSDHPLLGDSQYNIAQIYRKLGKLDQSNALFERCLNTTRDSRGARHPLVANILYSLAEVNNVMAKYSYARELLVESLQIRLSIFKDINENHPDIIESYYGIAENMRCTGQYTSVKRSKTDKLFSTRKDKNYGGDSHSAGSSVLSKDESKASKVSKTNSKLSHKSNSNTQIHSTTVAEEEQNETIDEIGESVLSSIAMEKDLENNNPPGVAEKATAENVDSAAGSTLLNNNVNDSMVVENSTAANTDIAVHVQASTKPLIPDRPALTTEEDEVSAPTVMISAIEQLDNMSQKDVLDDYSLPGGKNMNSEQDLLEKLGLFKAMPLLEKVLHSLNALFAQNPAVNESHPLVIQTKFSIAETLKAVGQYDKAYVLFTEILAQRRILYGDNHPDVVQSMVSVGDILKALLKIFPETSGGNLDAKQIRQSKNAIPVGVTLVEHFSSIIRPNTSLALSHAPQEAIEDEKAHSPTRIKNLPSVKDPNWVFLSEPHLAKKKRETIKIQKGYMGYQFPNGKKPPRPETTANSVTRPQKVFTNDAKWMYDQGVNIQKKLFGEGVDHPMTANILFSKGELLRARRDYSLALKDYERALGMRRKLFRGTHPGIADCLNSMAEIFRIEGKYNQAAPLYEKALEIKQECFGGASHPSIADIKNNMAMLFFAQGKYNESQALFEEALSICEELLGPSHPSTAQSLNNLAGLMQASGQSDLALQMYTQVLTIKQKTYGEDHPDVAATLNNIGLLFKAQNNLVAAQEYYEKALNMLKKVYSDAHPDVATSLNNLAALYVTLGRRYEAKELYQQSIAIRSALFGLDHPSIAATKNNYGALLYAMQEYDGARDLFEDSLRIRRLTLGDEHPAVAESYNNIGLLLYSQGALNDAIPLYERALEIKLTAFGTANPSIATSMNNLAAIYHRLGDFDNAIHYYNQSYEIRAEMLGPEHVDTQASLANLSGAEKDKQKAIVQAKLNGTTYPAVMFAHNAHNNNLKKQQGVNNSAGGKRGSNDKGAAAGGFSERFEFNELEQLSIG